MGLHHNYQGVFSATDHNLSLLLKHTSLFLCPFQPGDKVMVIPSLSEAEATALFPNGVTTKELPSGKKYLRYTQPWSDPLVNCSLTLEIFGFGAFTCRVDWKHRCTSWWLQFFIVEWCLSQWPRSINMQCLVHLPSINTLVIYVHWTVLSFFTLLWTAEDVWWQHPAMSWTHH